MAASSDQQIVLLRNQQQLSRKHEYGDLIPHGPGQTVDEALQWVERCLDHKVAKKLHEWGIGPAADAEKIKGILLKSGITREERLCQSFKLGYPGTGDRKLAKHCLSLMRYAHP